MVRKTNNSIWSLTLVRSGGYEVSNELEDAIFSFGRTAEEVKTLPKCRIPKGLVNLLIKNKMVDEALETGFFLEISSKQIKEKGWIKFEQIIYVEPKLSSSCRPVVRAVFSVINGYDTFEINAFPWSESMPNQLWLKVSQLDDMTLAWILSQDKILCGDLNEQRNLHDFYELEISVPEPPEYLRLPPPPGTSYHFFDED